MGTAPHSKLAARVVPPTRPYERSGRRREPWILVQLILTQDWQRVLIRAKLFPHELRRPVKMVLYGIPLKLLPLHLACALDPPEAVVGLFLNLYSDGAKTPIKAVNDKTSRRLQKLLPERVRALRNNHKGMISNSSRSMISYTSRRGTLLSGLFRRSRQQQPESPSTLSEQHTYDDSKQTTQLQEQSLLWETGFGARRRKNATHWQLYSEFAPVNTDGSQVWDSDNYPATKGQESLSLIESFSNSSITSASHKSTILQLSPSGSIIPLPVASQETDSTSETSRAAHTLPNALFGIHWDLTPLWDVLADASCPDNSPLPIHVACLYQASPAVIKQLADAHPMGVVNSVLGMLPIHLTSAGWMLHALVPKPTPLQDVPETARKGLDNRASAKLPLHRCPHLRERQSVRLKETLTILCRASPQSIRIRSGNHGMTPVEYISEAMEESPEKQECLNLLQPGKTGEEHKTLCEEMPGSPLEQLKEMASTNPSMIFFDTCDESKELQLGPHMAFDSAVELRRSKTTSIHSLLMAKDWEGALSLAEDNPRHAQEWFYGVDDHQDETIHGMMETKKSTVWKRLALHLACVYRAPVGLVDVLLQANPKAATSTDPHSGVLPIHLACHYGSSYRLIKALLMHAPQTTKAVDNHGSSPLHRAVLAKSHYAIIELLVIADPVAVLVRNRNEKTPLDLAVETYGKDSIMTRLLEMVTLAQQRRR